MAVLDEPERLACLRLIRSDNVGPVTFRELINHYGSATQALARCPSCRAAAAATGPCVSLRKPKPRPSSRPLAASAPRHCSPSSPGTRRRWPHIDAPPPMLYVNGNARASGAPGPRHRRIAPGLGRRQRSSRDCSPPSSAAAGLAIVSGLARGIDAAAHEASLATGTIAVLAGGLDIVYPPEHDELQRRDRRAGCPRRPSSHQGSCRAAKDFPRRNRLISGLALGVLVVEAARRSGTLVTARFAAEQGREVFAVPGHPLDPRAEGTNQLLKYGRHAGHRAGRRSRRAFAAGAVRAARPSRSDAPRLRAPAPVGRARRLTSQADGSRARAHRARAPAHRRSTRSSAPPASPRATCASSSWSSTSPVASSGTGQQLVSRVEHRL